MSHMNISFLLCMKLSSHSNYGALCAWYLVCTFQMTRNKTIFRTGLSINRQLFICRTQISRVEVLTAIRLLSKVFDSWLHNTIRQVPNCTVPHCLSYAYHITLKLVESNATRSGSSGLSLGLPHSLLIYGPACAISMCNYSWTEHNQVAWTIRAAYAR